MASRHVRTMLQESAARWQHAPPPAPRATIDALVEEARIDLPNAYLTLLMFSDGAEGVLGIEPGWFQMWPAAHVMEYNRGYEVAQRIRGFFGFGSSGGGELLAFDTRMPPPWKIYMIPFIPMQEEQAICIADDFEAFIHAMGKEQEEV